MLRTVIIDDEPKGRKLLQQMVEKFCPDVEVSALAASAEEGIRAIKEFKPDLVFLDVEMPGQDGFDMLNSLGTVDFTVIFVTGHQHYAIRAIKASAFDYLLKPISPTDLRAAVDRALASRTKRQTGGEYDEFIRSLKRIHTKIGLPTQKGLVFVESTEILRCEADSNYTRIFLTSGERHYAAKTLKEFESLLTEFGFVRIHQSHLVNLQHIRQYMKGDGGAVILSDGTTIEVSRRHKEGLMRQLIHL